MNAGVGSLGEGKGVGFILVWTMECGWWEREKDEGPSWEDNDMGGDVGS